MLGWRRRRGGIIIFVMSGNVQSLGIQDHKLALEQDERFLIREYSCLSCMKVDSV